MIVDKEKLNKAITKIGANAADIIAEVLELQQYDPRSHKSLCPVHHEDTASFCFNPKKNTYHCFGCGRNIGLIDAYILKGYTFIESCKKVFDHASMKYAFGEHLMKDNRFYKYPVLPPESNKAKVYEYWATRKISKETIDYCGVTQDEKGNTVFPYYDTNDVLKNVKYRPSRPIVKGEPKMWFQKGADTEPLLWRMNQINTSEELVITEGCGDVMSLVEAGITNVVSIPMGAKSYEWISHNEEWLNNFDSIVLCGDNDEVGVEAMKEICIRLGSYRVKIADLPTEAIIDGKTYPLKDANEVLRALGKDALVKAIEEAKDTPVPELVDFSDVEDFDIESVGGIKTGIKPLDEKLMYLLYGTVTVLTGYPGSGKTSFISSIVAKTCDDGIPTFVFSRELSPALTKNWMSFVFAGDRNVKITKLDDSDALTYQVSNEIKKKISEKYRGLIHLYRDDASNDEDVILNAMKNSRKKYGTKLFIIDNLMCVNIKGADNDKNEAEKVFMSKLINFASVYNSCVILVAHPRKKQQGQGDELETSDVSGSAAIMNLAQTGLAIKRVTETEKKGIPKERGNGWKKPPNPYDVNLTIVKDRMRGYSGSVIGMYYSKPSRRFFTNRDEYNRQYKWDDNVYQNEIPYPVNDADEEIFGG